MTVTTTFSLDYLGDSTLAHPPGEVTGNSDVADFGSGGYATVADTNSGTAIGIYDINGNVIQNITTGNFSNPSVAAHNATNEVVVVGTSSSGDILWQTFSPDIAGSVINLTDITTLPCSNADIARRFDDKYAVAYQINFDDRAAVNLSVRAANGAEIRTIIVDDPFTAGSAEDPSVAYTVHGDIVVAWDRTDASGNTAIWYAIYDGGDGSTLQAPTLLDNIGSINAHPSVAPAAIGSGFTIAYEDNASGVSQIRTYTLGLSGNAGFTTATSGGTAHSDAAVANVGNIYGAAYTNTFDSGGLATYVELALYDSFTGALLTDPAHPLTISTGDAGYDPAIASYDYNRGRFLVSYSDSSDGEVHQRRVQLVETITGDGANNDLSPSTNGVAHIDGGAGNDTLNGGAGNDTLTGNAGNDKFGFNTALNGATNVDTITDFSAPNDTIVLARVAFTAFAAAHALTAAEFQSGAGLTAGTDADDRIVYNTTDGFLYYDADGVGGAASVHFATLNGHPAITNADIVVV